MKYIKTFERYRILKNREEIIRESVLQVNDIYKVKTMVDIPQSLINAYVKKVKDNTGNNLRQFFGDVDIAEEIVKYININNLDIDKLPNNALMGGTQAQGQAQAQGQGQAQAQGQGQAQAQGQGQAQAQGQGQAQAQGQGQVQAQGQAQAQGQGQGQAQAQVQGQVQAQGQGQVQAQGQEEFEEPEEETEEGEEKVKETEEETEEGEEELPL